MSNKETTLTPAQQAFIDALFGEAKGDVKKAIQLAGYSESTTVNSLFQSKTLREAVINAAKDIIAFHAPKAAMELIDGMVNPTTSGAALKIKAAESLLNRAGVAEQKSEDVNLKVPSGGLFILPAKQAKTDADTES